MHKFLPVLLLLILFTFIALNFQQLRREVAYGLHISGDTTTSCCQVVNILRQKGQFDDSANLAFFNGQVVDYPKASLLAYQNLPPQNNVLGTNNSQGEEKWIEVSLDQQHLWAREGNKVIMDFPISSGRWAPTPTGTFYIWYKTKYIRMTGGSKDLGTYYDLPNVPNDMFFYQGYALHGAYWHNNFGHPMSHGCVNEPLANAAAIFDWAGPSVPQGQNAIRASADNPGTRVWIH